MCIRDRLTPTDPTPKGKREKPSLRELEQQIRRDIEDGIDSTDKKMTLCQLYAKQNAQRANVKKSTQKQREQLMGLSELAAMGMMIPDAGGADYPGDYSGCFFALGGNIDMQGVEMCIRDSCNP